MYVGASSAGTCPSWPSVLRMRKVSLPACSQPWRRESADAVRLHAHVPHGSTVTRPLNTTARGVGVCYTALQRPPRAFCMPAAVAVAVASLSVRLSDHASGLPRLPIGVPWHGGLTQITCIYASNISRLLPSPGPALRRMLMLMVTRLHAIDQSLIESAADCTDWYNPHFT